MSFPSCNITNQVNENNTCCLPECSNGTTNTTCDQQCPIGMSLPSTYNYSALCQESSGISNFTDLTKICVPTCPPNYVEITLNNLALCMECKDICVCTLLREYISDVCSCDDEVTITPRDQSDQPEKTDNYFIFILSGSVGAIVIVIVASLICTCRWRRAYKRLENKHSQNQHRSFQLPSLESREQHDNGNHYADCDHEDKTQHRSFQLPSLESREQHDNGNHYADCDHEDKTQKRKTNLFRKKKTASEKCRGKNKINSKMNYDRNKDYESVNFTTKKKTESKNPEENVEVNRSINKQPASDEGANVYLSMCLQREGETGTSENIKPVSKVYESMKDISEIANGSADHSITLTNYNTNALSIPKSHDQSKKSHDTIPTVKLGKDAYLSNAGVLLRKQMVAPDITHKATEDKGKVSDPRSLKDETELEKSVQCTQAQPVYENVYIGKQIPIVKSGSSVGATMNADATS